MRTFQCLILLIFAGTLPPLCLASPLLQCPSDSTGGCLFSRAVEGSTNTLIKIYSHSSDDNAALTSQPPHLSPDLARRNLTDTNHDLKLHWTEIGIISNPINASYTYQKLYNAIIQDFQNFTNPAFLNDNPRIRGRLSLSFAALVLFFDFPPVGRLALRVYIQQFAQGMLRLIAIGVIYGTFQVAALTAYGVIWITLQIIYNGRDPALLERRAVPSISLPESSAAL